jgi:hypothetical protein
MMGLHENKLSEICNKTCLYPLYTGRCQAECLERFRKISGVKDYSIGEKKEAGGNDA